MSVMSEIERIKNAKSALKTSIENKGVSVGDGLINTYAGKVDEIEGGNYNAYKVATIQERDALTDVEDGDVCVVQQSTIANMTEATSSNVESILLTPTVVLPSALQDFIYASFESTSRNVRLDINGDSSGIEIGMEDMSSETYEQIQYTSQDGITFTTQDISEPTTYTFSEPVSWRNGEPWNDDFGYFLQIGSVEFPGIYQASVNGNIVTWNYLDIGITANSNGMFVGNNAYTSTGAVLGSLNKAQWGEKKYEVVENLPQTVEEGHIIIKNLFDTSLKYDELYITEKDFGNSISVQKLSDISLAEITSCTSSEYLGFSVDQLTGAERHFWIAQSTQENKTFIAEFNTSTGEFYNRLTFSTSYSPRYSLGFVKDDYIYLFRYSSSAYNKKININTWTESSIAACPHYNSVQYYQVPSHFAIFDNIAICIWRTNVYTYNISNNSWSSNTVIGDSDYSYLGENTYWLFNLDATNCLFFYGSIYKYNISTRVQTKYTPASLGGSVVLGNITDKNVFAKYDYSIKNLDLSGNDVYMEIMALYSHDIGTRFTIKSADNSFYYIFQNAVYKMTFNENLHINRTLITQNTKTANFPYNLIVQVKNDGIPLTLDTNLKDFRVKNIYFYYSSFMYSSVVSPLRGYVNNGVYIGNNNQWELLIDYSQEESNG